MKIVVACGGTSPEREVSLNSGEAVASALAEFGHDVIKADIRSPEEIVFNWADYDADGVFVALHGDWGEDGTLQACLASHGIPFTGSGAEACMFGMYKDVARFLFDASGVQIAEGYAKPKGSAFDDRDTAMLEKYGHLIIKPNSGGSTVGLTQVKSREDFERGMELAWNSYVYEDKALVEQYIPGREATCPVWERADGSLIALPVIEIKPKEGFYDYKNKYTHGNTEYVCPAEFDAELTAKVQQAALLVHKSLGARAYSRTDFRITDDGGVYALEANLAPGMTSTSLVPKAAKAYGVSFPEFLDEIVRVSFGIQRKYQ